MYLHLPLNWSAPKNFACTVLILAALLKNNSFSAFSSVVDLCVSTVNCIGVLRTVETQRLCLTGRLP